PRSPPSSAGTRCSGRPPAPSSVTPATSPRVTCSTAAWPAATSPSRSGSPRAERAVASRRYDPHPGLTWPVARRPAPRRTVRRSVRALCQTWRMSTPEVETLSYEQAREELQDVVRRLETGAATLEESMELWERGEALATRCQQWLDGARERLAAAQQEHRTAADEEAEG